MPMNNHICENSVKSYFTLVRTLEPNLPDAPQPMFIGVLALMVDIYVPFCWGLCEKAGV